uniref:BMA-MTM-9, isoform e n=1 Tax=Brugia malayi TaxID=6279 RepID=A0A1I9G4U9_BRUMA|nr:BMA-MTM-9, isoform e [Brugia malayi]
MELSEAIERSRVDNVFLRKGPRQPQPGSLALIGHHMIFSPSSSSTNSPSGKEHSSELWLLHRAVDRVIVEPIVKDSFNRSGKLILKCKNFMICIFEIDDLDDCLAVARSIEKLSNLKGIQHDYPFYYRCPFTVLDNGWTAFDAEQEYAKLMIRCKDGWRISAVNKGFRVCNTYPEMVIVPKGIGDDYLRISATFRDGGRFPILSFYHGETKSCLIRCGQPLVGPTNRRCKEDETILNSLLSSTSKGVIVDTRTKAVAQNAKNKVCTETNISIDRWISRLGSCGWLQFVSDMLTCAATVAQCIHCEGSAEVPVVVHGAEGTDSTLLITSLAQLLLDSDSRTIRGFESLIEREWICAGHPFSYRCAHSAFATGGITGPHESPMFLCFLDCVWQVYQQFPCSFEFTEEFLIFLFEHAYASEFGSFLGNNEKEKARFEVKTRTVSLWSYVNNPEILCTYVNALYEPNPAVLWPCVAPQSIAFWERLFLRWIRDWKQMDGIKQTVMQWKVREKELQSKVLTLRRQLLELSKDIQLTSAVH